MFFPFLSFDLFEWEARKSKTKKKKRKKYLREKKCTLPCKFPILYIVTPSVDRSIVPSIVFFFWLQKSDSSQFLESIFFGVKNLRPRHASPRPSHANASWIYSENNFLFCCITLLLYAAPVDIFLENVLCFQLAAGEQKFEALIVAAVCWPSLTYISWKRVIFSARRRRKKKKFEQFFWSQKKIALGS